MNNLMQNYWPIFQMYQSLRTQLLEILTDEDLGYRVGSANVPLGVLLREIGEVEVAYIASFKTFMLDFSYRNPDPTLEQSVQKLKDWFVELDQELQTTIEGLSDEDIQQRMITRGGNFIVPVQIQLEIYKEALLIFYGKASVYAKALGKSLPHQWQEWIA